VGTYLEPLRASRPAPFNKTNIGVLDGALLPQLELVLKKEKTMLNLKTLAAVAVASLVGVSASAGGLSEVRAAFGSVSASQIQTRLPSSADEFSVLAAQVGGVTMTVRNHLLDVDTLSASVYEADGFQNVRNGVAAARGVSGIVGVAVAD
jgi:hypothetical protein